MNRKLQNPKSKIILEFLKFKNFVIGVYFGFWARLPIARFLMICVLGGQALGFGFAFKANAATYWVSPTGQAAWTNCQSAIPLDGAAGCSVQTAAANAAAGDTVYFRGGTYSITGQYGEAFHPSQSGASSNPIIFAAATGELPQFQGVPGFRQWGLWMDGISYVTIDGLVFRNFSDSALIRNGAHHIEVKNCTFSTDPGVTIGMGGFGMYEACGGNDFTCPVSHLWVHHNVFSRLAGGGTCSDGRIIEGGDAVRIGFPPRTCGTDASNNPIPGTCTSGADHHITVEDNVIEYAGHTGFDSYGQYLVIKNNFVHNEPWYQENNQGCAAAWPTTYLNPAYNGKYGHRDFGIDDDFGRDSTFILLEGNRMGNASVNPNNDGADSIAVAAPKNIIRYNYFYNSMNNGVLFKWGPLSVDPSGGINNRFYNNTVYHNGYGYPTYETCGGATCPEPLSGVHFYYWDTTSGNVIKNNIAYGNRSYSFRPNNFPSIIYGYDIENSSINTIVNNWTTVDGDPKFINPDLSQPANPALPDLSLQANSGAVDAGTSLTQSVGAGINSTHLVVGDALFFQDGTWGSDLAVTSGGFQADWIAVGSIANIGQISSINYSNNTVTLKTPLTWTAGAPVWLFKDSSGKQVLYGNAPDMGASEFCTGNCASSNPLPTPIATPTPSSSWRETKLGSFKNIFNLAKEKSLTINFEVANQTHVTLTLYDRKGNLVKKIVDDERQGPQSVAWDGTNASGAVVASGVYVLQFKSGDVKQTKKVVVIK